MTTTQIFSATAGIFLGLANLASSYQPLRFKSATLNHNKLTEDITHGDSASGTTSIAEVGRDWSITVNQCMFEDSTADSILVDILNTNAITRIYPYILYRKNHESGLSLVGECMLVSASISGRSSSLVMADLNFTGKNELINLDITPTASPALSNENKAVVQHNTFIRQSMAAPMALTDEAMQQVGMGARTQFRITNVERRVLNKLITPVVKVGGASGTVVASTNYTVDYLSGTVTAVGAFTFGAGDIVITASYYPLVDIAQASDFDINVSFTELPNTTIVSQRTSAGYTNVAQGRKTASISVSQFDEPNNDGYNAINNRDNTFLIETRIGHGITGHYITVVGWFKPSSRNTSLSEDSLNEVSLDFVMATDGSGDNSFSIYRE